jgi:TetR/AcrR family transcriptional repressor of nem operon
MGRDNGKVNAIVARYYGAVETGFRGAVARGQADGSIRADLDIEETARWLMLTGQGLSVSARFGMKNPGILRAIVGALAPAELPKS